MSWIGLFRRLLKGALPADSAIQPVVAINQSMFILFPEQD
jgi:hypothetical protein